MENSFFKTKKKNKKIALRPFVNNEKFEFEIVKNPNFDQSVVLQEGR